MDLRTRTTRVAWRGSVHYSPYLLSNDSNNDLSQSYNRMRATWAVSEHQAKEAENVKIFKDKYSACIAGSAYHDLVCGHRIQSTHPIASCGVNCKKIQDGKEIQDCEEMQDGENVQNDDEDATIPRMAMRIRESRMTSAADDSYVETAFLKMCDSRCSSKTLPCPTRTKLWTTSARSANKRSALLLMPRSVSSSSIAITCVRSPRNATIRSYISSISS
jgi:hypothetical protein